MRKSLMALAVALAAGPVLAADLRVAVDPTYEPFTYKTPSGEVTGFDVDIAKAVCEQLQRKCVFVEVRRDREFHVDDGRAPPRGGLQRPLLQDA